MRAVQITAFGPPAGLTLQDLPDLVPGPDQVLVQVSAAAINPSDVKNAQGLMPHTHLPRTPGRDFAGTVVAGQSTLIGTEVWGTGGDLGFTQDGTHAEFVLVSRQAVCAKPTHLSMEQAGSVGVPFVTAWCGLMDAAQLTAHDTVLVIGAAGAVGSATVQIANWKGARVIGVVRQDAQADTVRNLGADVVLTAAGEDLPAQVQAATEGRGANVIVDTVGGAMLEPCLQSLAPLGRLVEITAPERRAEFDLRDFYRRELRLLGVNTLARDSAACGRILQALAAGFETGALHPPPIAARYGLNQAREAYEQVADGTSGKVVLVPEQTE